MSTEIEFKTAGYYSFAVEVEKVNLHSIDNALEQAYLKMKVDPQYLFISEGQNYDALQEGIRANTNICHCSPDATDELARRPERHYMNQSTGRLMRIVPLPNAEPNVIIFGFITH